jgi:hypothetical protein
MKVESELKAKRIADEVRMRVEDEKRRLREQMEAQEKEEQRRAMLLEQERRRREEEERIKAARIADEVKKRVTHGAQRIAKELDARRLSEERRRMLALQQKVAIDRQAVPTDKSAFMQMVSEEKKKLEMYGMMGGVGLLVVPADSAGRTTSAVPNPSLLSPLAAAASAAATAATAARGASGTGRSGSNNNNSPSIRARSSSASRVRSLSSASVPAPSGRFFGGNLPPRDAPAPPTSSSSSNTRAPPSAPPSASASASAAPVVTPLTVPSMSRFSRTPVDSDSPVAVGI